MLVGLINLVFVFMCMITILLILIQKGKGNLGLGAIAGKQQMLFGGSGGQDSFQKLTWILCALIMVGSLSLAILKSKNSGAQPNYFSDIASKYGSPKES